MPSIPAMWRSVAAFFGNPKTSVQAACTGSLLPRVNINEIPKPA